MNKPYDRYFHKTVGSEVISSNDLAVQLAEHYYNSEVLDDLKPYARQIEKETLENIADNPEAYKNLNQPIGKVPKILKKTEKQEEPVFLFNMSNMLNDIGSALRTAMMPEVKPEKVEKEVESIVLDNYKKNIIKENPDILKKAVENSQILKEDRRIQNEIEKAKKALDGIEVLEVIGATKAPNIQWKGKEEFDGLVKEVMTDIGVEVKENPQVDLKNDFIFQIKKSLMQGLDVMKGKSHDYASKTNRYSNFEQAAKVAGTTTEQAILTLIGIKIARISELINAKKDPKNESLQDSYMDLINYICILNAYGQNWQ